MFQRSIWEEMGGFNAKVGLGYEEEQVNAFAINRFRPITIALDVLAGHFSYGPQTRAMINYLNKNIKNFS